jgi:carbon starvation protein
MAALSLIAVSVWLANRGKPSMFTAIPAVFMMLTTMAGLVLLLVRTYIPKGNVPLMVADLLLLVLALGVAYLAIRKLIELRRRPSTPVELPPVMAKTG